MKKVLAAVNPGNENPSQTRMRRRMKIIFRDRYLYLLALPGLFFFLLFKYIPMWGLVIAFQNYSPYVGILNSDWVGLEHFARFFSNSDFYILLRNTLAISFMNLLFFFPAPIILSIMMNEVRQVVLKRLIQTVIYFPHFLSWVIIAGISFIMLGQSEGVINSILSLFGMEKIPFLTSSSLFWPMLTLQNIWKDAGWGTVIFLAAISGIDPTLYEAAKMDGASKLKQIWHVTLPGIGNVILVLLILKLGDVMDVGFEQVFLMGSAAVSNVADVFDTYVYRNGVLNGEFSYTASVGLFKSIVGLIMVMGANKLAKMFGQDGLY
ncbi:ABC transporter permease [Paenibacillus mendelii]|uniref:ABC transporter permease n=1 Tax=Paenibacillus mendelii TaxID=206163 RepID=A0ABV6JKB7_9BACL|nr:ABC transporter permease subunit [Paenibacillus mendelii]MCQ6558870.1 ABC transporter permease subunit [Paenibacillus mendelii]